MNIYKGHSKSNAPNFIMYKQIIIATCIIHQKKGTSVRITFLVLHIVSTSLKSYSPSMNKGMYTSVVELSRLMSKPIQDSSFHFIVIAILVASESFFHWTKKVVVWWCQIRRIWQMWYHTPSKWSDGLHCPDACVRTCIVMLEEHIFHVQVGPNTSNFCFELPKSLNVYLRVNGFPFWQKIHKDYTLRIPKNRGHNFASRVLGLELFGPWWSWVTSFHWFPFRFRFKMVYPCFISSNDSFQKGGISMVLFQKLSAAANSFSLVVLRQLSGYSTGTHF